MGPLRLSHPTPLAQEALSPAGREVGVRRHIIGRGHWARPAIVSRFLTHRFQARVLEMFYELPPAGNAIRAHPPKEGSRPEEAFSGFEVTWVNAGAAAVALAVRAALEARSPTRRGVVIPAYTCPEVAAAVYHAGGEPVLVDFEPDTSWLNLAATETALATGEVAAVVAVDLFGIPERLDDLTRICRRYGAVLIEDSAQRFPASAAAPTWQGDLVVLSFGRGKPVSVLGGGALIARDSHWRDRLREMSLRLPETVSGAGRLRMKIRLYNWLRSPRRYWIPAHLPGLGLGQTVYKPIESVARMAPELHSLLSSTIQSYCQRGPVVEALIHDGLKSVPTGQGLVDLPGRLLEGPPPRLSRYPILLPPESRERLFALLSRRGLGASRMYGRTLPRIPGLEMLLAGQGPFPGADDFARRLVTLPTHDQVTARHVRAIVATLTTASRASVP